jgi:hypothetical protein
MPDSLWPKIEIFPFLGDTGRRLGSISLRGVGRSVTSQGLPAILGRHTAGACGLTCQLRVDAFVDRPHEIGAFMYD